MAIARAWNGRQAAGIWAKHLFEAHGLARGTSVFAIFCLNSTLWVILPRQDEVYESRSPKRMMSPHHPAPEGLGWGKLCMVHQTRFEEAESHMLVQLTLPCIRKL